MDSEELLKRSVEANASDIFIIHGLPITFKVGGRQIRLEDNGKLMPQQTEELIRAIYAHAGRSEKAMEAADTDDDFSFMLAGIGRFRINVFHQRGSLSAVVRVIKFDLPTAEIMYCNIAIRNLIRESKTYQMESAIQAGAAQGMRTMDSSLLEMVKDGIISKDTALTYCINYEAMSRKLK